MALKGQITLFAGSFAPKGWAYCDGTNGTPNIPAKIINQHQKMNYIICTADNNDDELIGQIIETTTEYAPKGWVFCNGQLLRISDNQALFTILNTTYGGSGVDTFAVPKLDAVKTENVVKLVDYNRVRYIMSVKGEYPRRP
jgi:microcystin-dependent protein